MNEEYAESQEIAEECERFFWYVNDHWDEYCTFCETHDPAEFPVPNKNSDTNNKYVETGGKENDDYFNHIRKRRRR